MPRAAVVYRAAFDQRPVRARRPLPRCSPRHPWLIVAFGVCLIGHALAPQAAETVYKSYLADGSISYGQVPDEYALRIERLRFGPYARPRAPRSCPCEPDAARYTEPADDALAWTQPPRLLERRRGSVRADRRQHLAPGQDNTRQRPRRALRDDPGSPRARIGGGLGPSERVTPPQAPGAGGSLRSAPPLAPLPDTLPDGLPDNPRDRLPERLPDNPRDRLPERLPDNPRDRLVPPANRNLPERLRPQPPPAPGFNPILPAPRSLPPGGGLTAPPRPTPDSAPPVIGIPRGTV